METIVTYRTNEAGKQVKVTTTIRAELKPVSTPAERRQCARFGDARNDDVKPVKGEEITLRLFPKTARASIEVEQQTKPAAATRYVCKTCRGDHLTFQCPHKDSIATTDPALAGLSAPPPGVVPGISGPSGAAALGGAVPGAGGAKYVPPALRSGMGPGGSGIGPGIGGSGIGGPGMGGKMMRDESSTLRVSNLPESITEAALRQNFSRFGRIGRCHVPQSKLAGRSRGFAFIEFDLPSQAEKARQHFDGVAVDSMIMHVEFAKPRDN